jgi:hypothetical protein
LVPTAKTIQDIDDKKLDVAGGTMTGDLTIPDKIIHSGDTNTAIRFPSADTFAIETDGTEKIRATSTAVVVNESGLDQDFRVEGDTDANLLFVDASADKVGIGTTQAISKFQVNNIASATSFFSVVGGEAIVSGNSVTVSKTQRGILHIENNQLQSVGRNASLTFGLGGSQFVDTAYHISGAIRTETTGSVNLSVNPKMVFSVLDGVSTTGTLVDRLEISHNGNVGIGTTSPATKLDVNGSIRASTGILFGTDTASANTLSDYEEGTFDFGIAFGGDSVAVTYTHRGGKYVKNGDQVTVTGRIQLTSKGTSTGNVTITGLPFTVPNFQANYSAVSFGAVQNITYNGVISAINVINTTTISLGETSEAGTNTVLTDADFANNSQIILSLTYFTF